MLKKCQEEFYNLDNTSLNSKLNNNVDAKEEKETLRKIKIGNINLIADLFMNNFIPIKIIQDCVEFLFKNSDEDKILYLCELTKKTYSKIEAEDNETLDKIYKKLESIL